MKIGVGLVVVALAGLSGAPASAPSDLRADVKEAIDRGLKWLRTQQQDDGSWEHYPGITALAALAYSRSPRQYRPGDGPFVRKPLDYLAGLQKADGGIYDKDLPAYNTSVAILALKESGDPKYADAIRKARDFLVKLQADETEGYAARDKFYGGIGYGSSERPDLSNLQMALEALQASELPSDDPAWKKAIVFLQRCQNRSESNDQAWSANDGGFVYYPGFSEASGTTSYGSMTYAGLKSFLHAQVGPDDPRVKAAVHWIEQHYTVDENPGMGAQGLYYSYHTFGKALKTLGAKTVKDKDGREHDWYADLARKLLSLQKQDGYWINEKSGRWWEDKPVLATAYAILALESGY